MNLLCCISNGILIYLLCCMFFNLLNRYLWDYDLIRGLSVFGRYLAHSWFWGVIKAYEFRFVYSSLILF